MKALIKTLRDILIVSLPTLILLIIILELFFRFIIPASFPPSGFFREDEKMYSFSNDKESGHVYMGKFPKKKVKWRINNMNWNFPIDYFPVEDKSLIAVIGDSYIEALGVDVDKNYPFLLRNKFFPDYEVYAFGKSGAPLSQYLHVNRYLNKNLNPDIVIFNVVHNDFDESIYNLYPSKKYFLQLENIQGENIFVETKPRPDFSFEQYQPIKKVLKESSLFRYLYFDLEISNFWKKIKRNNKSIKFEANVDPEKIKEKQQIIEKATDYLIKTISEENINKRIIFVLDAPRHSIYHGTLEDSSVWWIHIMMEEICKRYDVELIDLTDFMNKDFNQNGRKFNFDFDYHWDEYGHEFVSKVVYEYIRTSNIE